MSHRTILYISKGANSPSTRYRAMQYASLFESAGWKFQHLGDKRSFLNRISILREAKCSDVVVILRRVYNPFFFFLLRYCSKYLVFDFDDAIFLKSRGQASRGREKGFVRTVSFCDQVWAGNSYLADKARSYNEKVTILPTSVDTEKYDQDVGKPINSLDIVWIGSTATKKHLLTVLPALEKALKSIPTLRLKIIADFSLETDKLDVVPVRWSETREATELASAHIGIAPLPDNSYTRGKCALKIIQYMAASLPVISSPTGVNKDIVENGVTGILADDKQGWVDAIKKLAGDNKLRSSMGKAGRRRCVEHFTLQAVFQKMLTALEQGIVNRQSGR